jgi:putative hydrolase of the HAD superfamily
VIEAVLFDLDDTLFDQRRWLAGAWRTVARAAAPLGVDPVVFHAALLDVAAEGSARGRIIDRALARAGAPSVEVAPLVDAFKTHRPASLPLYPGAGDALEWLAPRVRLGLVTDGDPGIQRSKLEALGVAGAFDAIVFSDELGRERRKPHPAPFLAALDALGADPDATAFVGDRPDKDTEGALGAGLLAVRVRTGEYASMPDDPRPWRTVADVVEAALVLTPLFGKSRLSIL